jgi:hypothetical protein
MRGFRVITGKKRRSRSLITLGVWHGRETRTEHPTIIIHRIEKRATDRITLLVETAGASAQVEELREKRVGGEAEVTVETGAIALAGVDP